MEQPYIGEIRLMAFATVPQGWLACNGQELQCAQYSVLAQLLGNTFGGSSATFKLPDLRGRAPMGIDSAHPMAKSGGEEGVSLEGFMPRHSHLMKATPTEGKNDYPKGHMLGAMTASEVMLYSDVPPPEENPATLHPKAVAYAGESARHNNMQPSLVVSFCIACSGLDPRTTGQE